MKFLINYFIIIVIIIVIIMSVTVHSRDNLLNYDSESLQTQDSDSGKNKSKQNDKIFSYELSNEDITFITDLLNKIRIRSKDPNSKILLPWSLHKKSYVPLLIPALNDRNEDVRYYAMRYLADIKDKTCIPYIRKIMIDENESEYVRSRAINHLSNKYSLFDEKSIPYIKKYLNHESKVIQIEALRTIADLKDTESLDNVRDIILKEKDEKLLNVAIGVLKILGEPNETNINYLLLNMFDEHDLVKSSVIKALSKIGDKYVLDLLNDLKESLIHKLKSIKKVETMTHAYNNRSGNFNNRIGFLFNDKLHKANVECSGLIYFIENAIEEIKNRENVK